MAARRPPWIWDDGLVVEMHESISGLRLWYRVGVPDAERKIVEWGEATRYDRGLAPNVALDKGIVMEVHESHNSNDLWYRVGSADAERKAVTWGTGWNYGEGILPAVTVSVGEKSADFDGSGRVDFSDFLVFAKAFGSEAGDPDFETRFDLDGDGRIGFGDFIRFAQQFGA